MTTREGMMKAAEICEALGDEQFAKVTKRGNAGFATMAQRHYLNCADAIRRAAAELPDEPTLTDERGNAIFSAYIGIMVLRTMCHKAKLTAAERRSEELLQELDDAFPGLAARSALRMESPK